MSDFPSTTPPPPPLLPLWFQEVHSQLCNHKASLQRVTEGVKMKYSDASSPVWLEFDGRLQDVSQSLQKVQVKVQETRRFD